MRGMRRNKCKMDKYPNKQTRILIAPLNIIMVKKSTIASTEVDNHETIDNYKSVQQEVTDTCKNSDAKSGRSESNKKESYLQCLSSGVLGALTTFVFLVMCAFFIPGFRYSSYYVNEDPSQLAQLLTSNLSERDSLTVAKAIEDETVRRKDLIEDLLSQKVIISSEDFVSNLTSYYNALIAVLAAVLVILNLFGFFAWRSNAAEVLEQEKRKLSNEIDNIDNRLENNLEEVLRKNQAVREKLESYFQRLIDQDNHLSDEDWEKLTLLLKKYKIVKKENVLVKNNVDDNSNDGLIEEV